jgi:hypothetical protein
MQADFKVGLWFVMSHTSEALSLYKYLHPEACRSLRSRPGTGNDCLLSGYDAETVEINPLR